MSRNDQIAEFLARKGATVCPAAESFKDQAGSLKRLRRETEQALTAPCEDEVGDPEVQERERGAEARYLELQGVHA